MLRIFELPQMPGVVFRPMSERWVVVPNAVSVTDGEQPFDTWDGLVRASEDVMFRLFAFAPPIAPPTIAPITVNTTRPITAPPFFVCQKG